jgi:hypothetical protein
VLVVAESCWNQPYIFSSVNSRNNCLYISLANNYFLKNHMSSSSCTYSTPDTNFH